MISYKIQIMEQLYVKLMKQCIELAKSGCGHVSPNPLVGCVIVNQNGEIISTGYHAKYGQNHAERDALLKLDNANGCTLVVNLEPCSHFGKTPPCVDLIIEKGVKTVVYGMKDVNSIVAGNGLKKLRDAGIEVIGPVLEDECKNLNEIFIKNHTKKQTFVALKTATTIDGKIATHCGDSKWITSENARAKVKEIRGMYDAILTSSSTIIADNPTMEHRNKIILDRELKTDLNSNIYKSGNIFIFYDEKLNISSPAESIERDARRANSCHPELDSGSNNISYISTPVADNKLDIKFILKKLYSLGIMSVLVEAGGVLNGSFLPYIDKLYHFTAPKILSDNSGKSCFGGKNIEKISDCINLEYEKTEIYPPDILNIYKKSDLC